MEVGWERKLLIKEIPPALRISLASLSLSTASKRRPALATEGSFDRINWTANRVPSMPASAVLIECVKAVLPPLSAAIMATPNALAACSWIKGWVELNNNTKECTPLASSMISTLRLLLRRSLVKAMVHQSCSCSFV